MSHTSQLWASATFVTGYAQLITSLHLRVLSFVIPLAPFLLVHFQSAFSISHLKPTPLIYLFSSYSIQTSSFHPFCHVLYSLFSFVFYPLSNNPSSFSSTSHLHRIPQFFHFCLPPCLLFMSGLWRLLAFCCDQEIFIDIRNILISSGQVGTIFVSCRQHLLSA